MKPKPLESVKKALNRFSPESNASVDEHSATLYECPSCERIYVSDEMAGCSECKVSVEEVSKNE